MSFGPGSNHRLLHDVLCLIASCWIGMIPALGQEDEQPTTFSDSHVENVEVLWASWGVDGHARQIDVTEIVAKQVEEQGRIVFDAKSFNSISGDPVPGKRKMLVCVMEFGDRILRVGLIDSTFVFKPADSGIPVAGPDSSWNEAEIKRRQDLLGPEKEGLGVIWARWGNYGPGGGWGEASAPIDKQIKDSNIVKNKTSNLGVRTASRNKNKMLRVMIAIDGHPVASNLRFGSYIMLEPNEAQQTAPAAFTRPQVTEPKPSTQIANKDNPVESKDTKPAPKPDTSSQMKKPEGTAQTKPATPNVESPKNQTANASKPDLIIPFPGKVDNLCTGGGGQFLILHIKEKKQLAIFDFAQRKIVKELEVPDDIVFAANRTKLLIAQNHTSQLQRWNLATMELERTVRLESKVAPILAAMGSNGDGPLVLGSAADTEFWDVEKMETIQFPTVPFPAAGRHGYDMSVSSDGKTFCGWFPGSSGQPYRVLRLHDGQISVLRTRAYSQGGRWAMPTTNGDKLLCSGGGAHAFDMNPHSIEPERSTFYLPTEDPRYVIHVRMLDRARDFEPTICSAADFQPIYKLPPFKAAHDASQHRDWSRMGGEPRIRFLPQQKLVAVLPSSRDSIILRELDLEKELAKSKTYLAVNSIPSPSLQFGETFAYQLESLSSSPVKYALLTGPEGMTVTADGAVTWPATHLVDHGVADVKIEAQNADGIRYTHSFEIIVYKNNRVVASTGGPPPERNSPPPVDAARGAANIVFQETPGETVINLPAKFTRVRSGGGGRYLIFHIPPTSSLHIVDVEKRALVKEVPVTEDAVFAANRSKLLIAMPSRQQLQRWDLAKGNLEQTVELKPSEHPVKLAVMGADGDGPLALWGNGDVELWDADEMKLIPKRGDRIAAPQQALRMTVSADGKTFCGWVRGSSGARFQVMRVHPRSTSVTRSEDTHGRNQKWAMPDANGGTLLRYGGGAYNRAFVAFEHGFTETNLMPTHDARFALGIRRQDRNLAQATICTAADLSPIITLKDLPIVDRSRPEFVFDDSCQPRVHFFHDQNLVWYLPIEDDRLVIKQLDLIRELEAVQPEYLFVISKPNPVGTVGESYQYQLDSISDSDGKIQYSLKSAPDGMELGPDGLIQWDVKKRPENGSVQVTVEAETTDGNQFEHQFDIAIQRDLDKKYVANAKGKFAKDGFVQLDDFRLELPGEVTSMTRGLDGRMLILCGNQLAIIKEDGWTVEKTHTLEQNYMKIEERKDYFVAIANEPKGVFVLHKHTLNVIRSLSLDGQIQDLAIHPTLPISYIAARRGSSLPHYKFIAFNEKSGEGFENDEWIGNWIAVDPGGDFLITGYSDLYRDGSELLLNPTRWHVVPTYGSLDWLIRYRLDREGKPDLQELKENVGGNGDAVKLSGNGKRVTYLSFTGYPGNSKNLAGWDPEDFSKMPVLYDLQKRGTPREFEFHPWLSLCASANNGSVILLDSDTGAVEDKKLDADLSELDDIPKFKVAFSPDGTNLVLAGRINGIDYLHKIPLKLTPSEVRRAGTARTNRASAAEPKTPAASIRLVELNALNGEIGEEMSTADIAREFSESVVVVQSGQASGTGFVVGKNGYILTCAHCVPNEEDILVMSKRPNGNLMELNATAVAVDEEKDLALIKIREQRTLKPIRLGLGHKVETGIPVSAIGNPGVGNQILDYTMTQGIVSTPRRMIDELPYIQTTAAINPGSSGGPLFNDKGMVVGMVVLKARIEGAGFAIPAETIGEFLMKHLEDQPESLAIERSWYNAQGEGPLIGTYQGYRDGHVKIVRSDDGEEFSLPIETLSEPDQQFVKILARARRDRK